MTAPGQPQKSSPSPEDVLDFWLVALTPAQWYEQDDALDARIRAQFEGVWGLARDGALEGWAETPRGALALLILLDQFPRNMFRGDEAAFSTDATALTYAKAAVAAGHDLAIPNPERQFFYLPYMHSEEMADQHACVALIAERAPPDNLYHAHVHRAVVERFGRFPYRNAVLGRENTPDEAAYIAAGLYEPEGWNAPDFVTEKTS